MADPRQPSFWQTDAGKFVKRVGDHIIEVMHQGAESAHRAGFERCRDAVLKVLDETKPVTNAEDFAVLRTRIQEIQWEDTE